MSGVAGKETPADPNVGKAFNEQPSVERVAMSVGGPGPNQPDVASQPDPEIARIAAIHKRRANVEQLLANGISRADLLHEDDYKFLAEHDAPWILLLLKSRPQGTKD